MGSCSYTPQETFDAQSDGSSGKSYAVDINPVGLRELRSALGTDDPNVEVVRGEEDDPRRPAASRE